MRRKRQTEDEALLEAKARLDALVRVETEQREAELQRTLAVARAVAEAPGFSVVGGGDTIAALATAGVTERIGYVSTAGGAFLEFLEGRRLPGVEALTEAPA